MADQPAHMWDYWSGKKGVEEALRTYYPDKLKDDPRLASCLGQITGAKLVIEALMQSYEEKESRDGKQPE